MLFHNGCADAARGFNLLVIIVEAVGNNGLRSIFVRDYLLRGEGGGLVELLVIGPVGAAAQNLWLAHECEKIGQDGQNSGGRICPLTFLVATFSIRGVDRESRYGKLSGVKF